MARSQLPGWGLRSRKGCRSRCQVFTIPAPGEDCVADASRLGARLVGQIVAEDLEQADQQVPACDDAADAVKLGDSLVQIVRLDDAPGRAPGYAIVADALADASAVAP